MILALETPLSTDGLTLHYPTPSWARMHAHTHIQVCEKKLSAVNVVYVCVCVTRTT